MFQTGTFSLIVLQICIWYNYWHFSVLLINSSSSHLNLLIDSDFMTKSLSVHYQTCNNIDYYLSRLRPLKFSITAILRINFWEIKVYAPSFTNTLYAIIFRNHYTSNQTNKSSHLCQWVSAVIQMGRCNKIFGTTQIFDMSRLHRLL